jgi:methyltransferase (TIGR00027 family)
VSNAITHVSDTALWVATYRAIESERPDALFQDPFARLLAGERGRKIAEAMVYPKVMQWVLAIRTVAIDRLITHALTLGIDTVVNLGAGLDTRPYRMQLPADLHWIEVDFPQMILFKTERLAQEKPACRLKRIAADLSDIPLRRRIFENIGSSCRKALIVTEGVIPYLSPDDAAALSADLFAVRSFQYWIQDYRQGGMRRWVPRRVQRMFKDSPFKFDAVDWLGFFTRQGWTILENRFAVTEAERVHRPLPFIFPWSLLLFIVPRRVRERLRKASGYVLYARQSRGVYDANG